MAPIQHDRPVPRVEVVLETWAVVWPIIVAIAVATGLILIALAMSHRAERAWHMRLWALCKDLGRLVMIVTRTQRPRVTPTEQAQLDDAVRVVGGDFSDESSTSRGGDRGRN